MHKLAVLSETHPLHPSHHLLLVDFHKGKAPAPLPPDTSQYKCYVLEDEVMQNLMDVKAGSNRAPRAQGRGGVAEEAVAEGAGAARWIPKCRSVISSVCLAWLRKTFNEESQHGLW